MKKTLLITLALLTLVSLLLCSCTKSSETTDDFILASEMPAEKKAAADEVLNAFMRAYEEDKPEEALDLLSENFAATLEEMESFFNSTRNTIENPFVPMASYYMTNLPTKSSGESVRVKNSMDDTDYIEFIPSAKEQYCVMYKADGEKITYTLSLLLEEKKGKFAISWIAPGELSYAGNDAAKLFSLTKALNDKGELIPAYIYSCMLGNTIRPGAYYHYGNEAEMDELCYNIFAAISEKYELPLVLSDTNNSSLYVVGIENNADYGIIPLLLVKTDVDIKNTSALRAEARKVISAIDSLSGKLSDSFSYVELHMTNDELANETADVNYESVVLNLK